MIMSNKAKKGANINTIKVSKAGLSPIPPPRLLSFDLLYNLYKQ